MGDLPKFPQEAVAGRSAAIAEILNGMLPHIRDAARTAGYAVAVHGSMQRDIDLIAAPWTEHALSCDDFIWAVLIVVRAHVPAASTKNRQQKPHGRVAVAIGLGNGIWIDLSVMPCATR